MCLGSGQRTQAADFNTGEFSRIASERGVFTVSIDSDPGVVEANYLQTKDRKQKTLHPLLVDLRLSLGQTLRPTPAGLSGSAKGSRLPLDVTPIVSWPWHSFIAVSGWAV